MRRFYEDVLGFSLHCGFSLTATLENRATSLLTGTRSRAPLGSEA